MALKMGKDTFYDYIKSFGFAKKTGIDYSSEAAGIVTDKKYVTDNDLARIGFGQSVAVTPLQLINAVSAVINGGTLNTPSLVSHLEDADGKTVEDFSDKKGEQVISEDTSQKMRAILQSVVDEGSGSNARIDGYAVGGKTGTAQVYEDGKIVSGKNISSFIGFAPADNPKYVVLFIVYEPNVAVTYGSVVAAPYAKDVLEKCLKYGGVPAQETDNAEKTVRVPDITGKSFEEAEEILEKYGLILDFDGNGTIIAQSPTQGARVLSGSTIAAKAAGKSGKIAVPDVTGKSVSDAKALLEQSGFSVELSGQTDGTVTSQQPEAGKKLKKGETVKLTIG